MTHACVQATKNRGVMDNVPTSDRSANTRWRMLDSLVQMICLVLAMWKCRHSNLTRHSGLTRQLGGKCWQCGNAGTVTLLGIRASRGNWVASRSFQQIFVVSQAYSQGALFVLVCVAVP